MAGSIRRIPSAAAPSTEERISNQEGRSTSRVEAIRNCLITGRLAASASCGPLNGVFSLIRSSHIEGIYVIYRWLGTPALLPDINYQLLLLWSSPALYGAGLLKKVQKQRRRALRGKAKPGRFKNSVRCARSSVDPQPIGVQRRFPAQKFIWRPQQVCRAAAPARSAPSTGVRWPTSDQAGALHGCCRFDMLLAAAGPRRSP